MAKSNVPRRSALYMPGSNARALEKARTLPADILILDLEDAVSPDAKAVARDQVHNAVRAGFGSREVFIRVNGLDTPWGEDDIRVACAAKPGGILAPKVETSQDMARYEAEMTKHGATPGLALWLMMETAAAILNAPDIASMGKRPGSRVTGFVMGTNDLAKELGCRISPARETILPYLTQCILAARANGLCILDGVYGDIKDADGLANECEQGAALGFDGKTLIHPNQLDICNRAFAPSDLELEWARKIIAAFSRPENRDKGAISLDGRMVERLHAEQAEQLIALSDAIAAKN